MIRKKELGAIRSRLMVPVGKGVEVLKILCTVPLSIFGFIPKYLWHMVLKFHTVTSETDMLTFSKIFLTVAAGLNKVCSLLI